MPRYSGLSDTNPQLTCLLRRSFFLLKAVWCKHRAPHELWWVGSCIEAGTDTSARGMDCGIWCRFIGNNSHPIKKSGLTRVHGCVVVSRRGISISLYVMNDYCSVQAARIHARHSLKFEMSGRSRCKEKNIIKYTNYFIYPSSELPRTRTK